MNLVKKICHVVPFALLLGCSDSKTVKPEEEIVGSSSSGDNASSSSTFAEEDALSPAARMVKWMGQGINLGNALEAPSEGSWGVTLDASYFPLIADSGFTNVRIPARWDTHVTRETGVCVVDSAWMARVRWAVEQANQNGLIAVVDQHHYAGMYDSYATETECFLDIWKAVTREFLDISKDSLVLEILNEPQRTLTGTAWNDIVARTIDTIRAIDSSRTLMVGGDSWNSIDGMLRLQLPEEDDNIIATFHYYDPHNFTHQGNNWEANPPPMGVTWRAEDTQKSAIRSAFAKAVDWSVLHNRPLYLGEFGVYSMADDTSREIWTEFVAAEARRLGIASAYWEFCSGFGVYNAATQEWKQYLMNALLHPSRGFESEIKRPKLDTTDFVLLDDFDAFDGELANVNAISQLLAVKAGIPLDSAPGRWYAYHSMESRIFRADGDTLMTGDLIRMDSTRKAGTKERQYDLIADGGHSGRGLYAKMHLLGSGYPFVGIGVSINAPTKEYNFGNMVALSFWARGSGEFKVGWLSAFTDTCCTDTWGKFSKEIILTPEWKQYVIWYDEWAPAPWSGLEKAGYTWKDHPKASQLQFLNGQSYGEVVDVEMEIQIDDVRFYGMAKKEFGL